jgi:hypothetical protein
MLNLIVVPYISIVNLHIFIQKMCIRIIVLKVYVVDLSYKSLSLVSKLIHKSL